MKTWLLAGVGASLILSGCAIDLPTQISQRCRQTGQVWTYPPLGTVPSPNPDVNNGAVNICAHPAAYVSDQITIKSMWGLGYAR